MKIKILLVFTVVFFTLESQAQNKRNIFYCSGAGAIRAGLFNSLVGSYSIKVNRGQSVSFNTRSAEFNGRLNAGYTFLASKRFGFGLRFSYQRLRVRVPNEVYIEYDYDNFPSADNNGFLEFESPVFNSYTTLFVLKFAPKMSMLPFGMEYTIGGGPRFFSMVNRPYFGVYIDPDGNRVKGDIPQINNTDLENQRYRGAELFYGMELNYPVSQNSFIFLGCDFSLTLVNESSYQQLKEPSFDVTVVEEKVEDVFYNRNYGSELRRRTIFSIATFKVGYKIAF